MTAPFDETGPSGDPSRGGLGPVILTMRGGHPEEYQRLRFLQDAGYVRDLDNPDVVKRMHEWQLRGNPNWWADDRWDMSQLESHHRMYLAMARMESAAPEEYERLMAEVERELQEDSHAG